MVIGTVLDHCLSWNGQIVLRHPGIESRTLRDFKGAEDPIVRHGSPTEGEIHRDKVGEPIKVVVFATENSGGDVVAGPARESPATHGRDRCPLLPPSAAGRSGR